jgi:hypothetical protein
VGVMGGLKSPEDSLLTKAFPGGSSVEGGDESKAQRSARVVDEPSRKNRPANAVM